MMEQLLRASSPFSETWLAWVMLLILCGIILSFFLQPNIIRNCFYNLFSDRMRDNQLERISFTYLSGGLLTFSHAMIFSMWVYFSFAITSSRYSFLGYLLVCGLFFGMYIVQELAFQLDCYVFFNDEILHTYHHYRLTRNTCMCLIGYPLLLLLMFTPWFSPLAVHIVALIFFSLLFLFTLIKLFRLFSMQGFGFLYILLYLCTLEMLPFLGWVYASFRLLGIMSL